MRSRYRGGAVVWEGRRREASPYPDQGASAGIDVDAAAGPLCFEPSRSGARAGRSGIRRRKDRPRSDCDGFPPPNWVPTVRFYPLGSGARRRRLVHGMVGMRLPRLVICCPKCRCISAIRLLWRCPGLGAHPSFSVGCGPHMRRFLRMLCS